MCTARAIEASCWRTAAGSPRRVGRRKRQRLRLRDSASGEIDRIVLLAHSAIAEPERMQGRKLFITSRGDTTGSGALRLPTIRDQHERSPGPKELVILDGAAHAQFIFQTDQGARLMREILRFLSEP